MGHASYGAPQVLTYAGDESTSLHVGKYSSVASSATFLLGGKYPLDRVTTFPLRSQLIILVSGSDGYLSSKGDIWVGNDAWIGHDALILSGVTIGNGTVVAARAVVTKDVPPYSIVAVNPAKVIRMRMPHEIAMK